MNLAEQIIYHCQIAPGAGYGAIMGATLPLKTLLSKVVQQRLTVADGVELMIPANCTWAASDQADGGVQLAFTGGLPTVFVRKGPITINPEITALVVRIGQAAFEVQASLRLAHVPLPPFTVTVPL